MLVVAGLVFAVPAVVVAPPGSLIQLVVSHGQQPGTVELHILDEGPGLSPEDCERAFGRFWRGTQGGEGSGLGLSIVHQLARASGAEAALRPRAPGPAPGATGLDACVQFRSA